MSVNCLISIINGIYMLFENNIDEKSIFPGLELITSDRTECFHELL